MKINIEKLENKIKIKFKNKKLLQESLTHKSFDYLKNNEKLEFLGDRILGLVLSKRILELYPEESLGDLDKRFAYLVNRTACANIGKKINLEKYIFLGKTYNQKTSIEDKILSDTCEALIGAIFLDKGFSIVEKFILKNWKDEIKKTIITKIDNKTKLQEYSLKKFKTLPLYNLVKTVGPRHNPEYKIGVKIKDSKTYYGNGFSKKEAEQNAAKNLLNDLEII